ncbi:MAG: molybdopterin molybdotransferase MoeA [Anaerolineales bacterium]|jgi:molybdopterin molybdotransferase|nr:molybdopterin molybdotransferase MoeA [Anaerolineales bacterium]
MIGFDEAYERTLQAIQPLDLEKVALLQAVGRVSGRDLSAPHNVPSAEVSFKDGYALKSADVQGASPAQPVRLRLAGSVAAGGSWQRAVQAGEAVRILSGAPLPPGADAVLADEFARVQPGMVQALNDAAPGCNILPRGADVQAGQCLVRAGQRLSPPAVGLLAAAGYAVVEVFRQPRVAVLATGDEVVAPGQPLEPGKLYASNLCTLAAWCLHYGFEVQTLVEPDDAAAIRQALTGCLEQYDAVVTSGGAWKGERDLTARLLDELGWQKIFHRLRIGPGKAAGFGLYGNKPVFILPGGPPSNHMAFLQLALPGLHRLAGYASPGLPLLPAILAEPISGQLDWTQFVHGRLEIDTGRLRFIPLRSSSRLVEMAQTDAVARIPEGIESIPAGSNILVQALHC